jgi:hypothetical protein
MWSNRSLPVRLSKKLLKAGGVTGLISHLSLSTFSLSIFIQNLNVNALVDTGASVSCVKQSFLSQMRKIDVNGNSSTTCLITADGKPIGVRGSVSLSFNLMQRQFHHTFYIIDNLSYPLILGLDFLSAHDIRLDCRQKLLMFPLTTSKSEEDSQQVQSIFEAGMAKIDPYRIQLKEGTIPVKQPIRRKAIVEKEMIGKQITEMLASRVIRESKSPWSSPIQLVPKKDGTDRFCVDYRLLNTKIVTDAFPLPHIGDLISRLFDAKIFSTLDLKSGYWQFPLHEKSKPITAFSTHDNHYEFNVLPFGISAAPAVFQRQMSKIFRDMKFVGVYMDDIIVFSRRLDDHKQHLHAVKQTLHDHNLQLNDKKCRYFQTEIDYLGMRITNGVMKVLPERIQPILDICAPQSKKQVQEFLGLVNFYREFCPGLAETAIPLYQLTHKDQSFEWTDTHQRAFEGVKKLLTSTPFLRIPDHRKPFCISTDASGLALGAVISQVTDACEYPVAYASRVLNEAEQKYSVIEKELLGIVFAVSKFRCFVYGTKFTVFCDHNPLKYISTMKDPSRRIARWLMLLQDYDFQVEYRPGKINLNADSLSRLPLAASLVPVDNDYGTLLSGGQVQSSSSYNPYISQITLEGGDLWFHKCGHKLKIPKPEERARLVRSVHCLGHFGISKTTKLLKELFWWPRMYFDSKSCVTNCPECERRKAPNKTDLANGPLNPFVASYPREVMAWDVMGPLPTSNRGNKYIVVVMDMFSRWVEMGPVKDIQAETLADFMWTRVISRYGPPVRIHSDRGTNLNATVIRKLYEIWGISKSTTVAYYPQGNGMVERMNRVIQDAVAKKNLNGDKRDWDECLPSVAFAYNVTPHAETQMSPFSLFLGGEPNIPVDGQVIRTSGEGKFEKLYQMWQKTQKRWQECHEDDTFHINDKVLLWRPNVGPGEPKKFATNWRGPFVICGRKNWGNYVIRGGSDSQKEFIVNRSQLKPYRGGIGTAVDGSLHDNNGMEGHVSNAEENHREDHGEDSEPCDRKRINNRYSFRPRIFAPKRFL